MSFLLRITVAVVTVVYPLGVYFGLQYFDPRTLVLLILLIVGMRLLTLQKSPLNHWLWIPLLLILGGWTWMANTDLGLKLYPVLVNVSFLLLFGWSLHQPPSMIERFARLQKADFPDAALGYMRKVTIIWCVFFTVNATIALITCFWASDRIWALYNGLVAYGLMGALFVGEWLVRQWVMKQDHG